MKKLKPIIAWAVVDKTYPTGFLMTPKTSQFHIYYSKKDARKSGWGIKIIKVRITPIK